MFDEFFDTIDALMAECTDRRVVKLASQARGHAQAAVESHSKGDAVGANAHMAQASQDLHDAAVFHAGRMNGLGKTPSPLVLDVAHLGKAQELHQKYTDSINEGMKNGR